MSRGPPRTWLPGIPGFALVDLAVKSWGCVLGFLAPLFAATPQLPGYVWKVSRIPETTYEYSSLSCGSKQKWQWDIQVGKSMRPRS